MYHRRGIRHTIDWKLPAHNTKRMDFPVTVLGRMVLIWYQALATRETDCTLGPPRPTRARMIQRFERWWRHLFSGECISVPKAERSTWLDLTWCTHFELIYRLTTTISRYENIHPLEATEKPRIHFPSYFENTTALCRFSDHNSPNFGNFTNITSTTH